MMIRRLTIQLLAWSACAAGMPAIVMPVFRSVDFDRDGQIRLHGLYASDHPEFYINLGSLGYVMWEDVYDETPHRSLTVRIPGWLVGSMAGLLVLATHAHVPFRRLRRRRRGLCVHCGDAVTSDSFRTCARCRLSVPYSVGRCVRFLAIGTLIAVAGALFLAAHQLSLTYRRPGSITFIHSESGRSPTPTFSHNLLMGLVRVERWNGLSCMGRRHVTIVEVSGWLLILVFGAYPATAAVRGRLTVRRRRRDGLCMSCGYDLRKLIDPRCPECGVPFDRYPP